MRSITRALCIFIGIYNVGVIVLKKPEYAVYSFIEDDGRTVVEKWFDDNHVPDIVWSDIYALWDFYKSFGPHSIRASVIDFGDGFYGLKIPRKGNPPACLIFRFGPLDEETEITFLAAAIWDEKLKRVRPFGALGTAEENLEILLKHRHRRRRG